MSIPAPRDESAAELCVRAEKLVRAGKREEALPLLQRALALDEGLPQAHKWIGALLVEAGEVYRDIVRLMEAIPHLEAARASSPDDCEILFPLGIALCTTGHNGAAVECFHRVLASWPEHWMAHHRMALVLVNLRRYDEALAHFDSAIRLKKDYLDPYLLKAMLLERMTRLGEARSVIEAALHIAPNHPPLLVPYGKLESRAGNLDVAQRYFEKALTHPQLAGMERAFIHGEIGKLFDKRGEYDAAYAQCVIAQQTIAGTSYARHIDPDVLPQRYGRYEEWFTPERVRAWGANMIDDGIASPIFLIGFPRSGTTLMEQICAAHPCMITTQEQPFLDRIAEEMGEHYPEMLDQMSNKDISRFRRLYWEFARQEFGTAMQGKYLVDKMPMNLVHLGLMARIFPDAKLLTMIRDPRDVILSCFMQTFQPNLATVHFDTLEKAAAFYDTAMRVWWALREAVPMPTLEIHYEILVDSMESQARTALDFLGLPWNEEVMNYHAPEHNRHVMTPSYEGVSVPAYRRSVGRWRHYATHIDALSECLRPWVERLGYDS